jgi:hypothetical protein
VSGEGPGPRSARPGSKLRFTERLAPRSARQRVSGIVRLRCCFVRRWKSNPCEVTPHVAEGNCIRREAGWEAAGGERAARRMTNPFRRRGAASPRSQGEAWMATSGRHTDVDEMVMTGPTTWLGVGCSDGRAKQAERPVARVRARQVSEPA